MNVAACASALAAALAAASAAARSASTRASFTRAHRKRSSHRLTAICALITAAFSLQKTPRARSPRAVA